MPMPADLTAQKAEELSRAETFSFDVDRYDQLKNEGGIVTIVIRAHLYVEHVLIQTLVDAFATPDSIDLRRLNFPMKVDLCISMGLISPEWRDAVMKVNELRNRVAHNLDFEFSDDVKEGVWRSLPGFLQEGVLFGAKLTQDQHNRLEYYQLFQVLILWLDVARQTSNKL